MANIRSVFKNHENIVFLKKKYLRSMLKAGHTGGQSQNLSDGRPHRKFDKTATYRGRCTGVCDFLARVSKKLNGIDNYMKSS